MSRLSIVTQNNAQKTVEDLYKDLERRITASQPGLCPVDLAASFLHKAIVAENNNWRVYAIVLMILSLSFVVILMIWMSNDSFV